MIGALEEDRIRIQVLNSSTSCRNTFIINFRQPVYASSDCPQARMQGLRCDLFNCLVENSKKPSLRSSIFNGVGWRGQDLLAPPANSISTSASCDRIRPSPSLESYASVYNSQLSVPLRPRANLDLHFPCNRNRLRVA
jgi:hypothetical protein